MKKALFAFIITLMPMTVWGFDFEKFTLENGMDVYFIPDNRTPVAVNFVWYKAGAADEENGKTGLAHMLEHLMFKGTENIPPQEFSKIVARNGGKDNAFTSYDYTAYFQKVAVENLPKMMEIEAERMRGLTFTDKEFQPERDVILEERRWRIESKPQNRFYEELAHHHFPNHPYGRPVIGWKKDIENYTYEMNHEWYKTYYQPSNAILIVIGDLTFAEAKPMIEKTYGQVPSTKKVEHPVWAEEPLFEKAKRYEKIDADVKVPIFVRSYRVPSLFSGIAGSDVKESDVYSLMVLAQILGGGSSSVLYEKLVKELELADSVSADFSPISRSEASFDVVINPKKGVKLSQIEKAFDDVIASFKAQAAVDVDVLKRAKTKLKSLDIYGRDDPFVAAYILGRYLIAGGEAENFKKWYEKVDAVTAENVSQIAKRYLDLQQSTTGLLVAKKDQF